MRLSLSSVLSVTVLLLGACAPTQTPTPTTGGAQQPTETRSSNQAITIAQIGLPATMSPAASASNIATYYAMYDSPTAMNENLEVIPWAAEKWTQVNPTTWRITMRKDLTFSNGDKLTAADVEFTGKLMLDERNPQLVHFPNLTEVKLVDEYNVDFITKIQDASVLPALAYLWLMPKNYYTTQGKDGFSAKPIGTGPYELVNFRASDIAEFKKRTTEHPFRKAQPTAITIRSITEQTQMINGLKTGDLDLILGNISPDRLDTLTEKDAVIKHRLGGVNVAVFSQTENIERKTPLTDKRVRQALNYAVDKDAIAKQIYRGYAQPTGQLSVPDSPSWDPNVKPYPYDPAKAKQLLAEAGYPNGFKLQVGLEYTPQTGNPQLMLAIQSSFRDIGVEMPVNEFEIGAFLDKFYGRNGQTKGDLFINSSGDGNGFMTTIVGYYTCKKPLVWWCNPEFDKNMELAVSEPDVTKRGAIMRKAVASIGDDVGVLYLFIAPGFIIHRPTIQGFEWASATSSTGFYRFDDLYRIN